MITISDYLVWIDCEMTGLNVEKDCLVEIAVVVTDSELNEMHTSSGLIKEFDQGHDLVTAEQMVLAYIQRWVTDPRTAPLAGNTIGTDRMFINRYMPELDNFLHYRNIDVSSIKELTRRWYPKVYFQLPKKDGGHRALADILESIKELRYYRKTVFVEQPGPTTEESKSAADSL